MLSKEINPSNMKTIILLSTLILTAASVNAQTRDWSGNRKKSSNNSSSSVVVKENKSREKVSVNNQRVASPSQFRNTSRSSNSGSVENSGRRHAQVSGNENRQTGKTDVTRNNSRNSSYTDVRRETNVSNREVRSTRTEFNYGENARRNAEKTYISNRDYTPVYTKEFRNKEHFGNSNFESRHTRIEHFNYRYNDRHHYFLPLAERRIRFPFFMPHFGCLIWSLELRNDYFLMYPEYRFREYSYGYRVPFVSAYDADEYIGEIATVYGDVLATEYAPETDEYYLYTGQYYPNQDFSVVVPGYIARNLSINPEAYFQGAHIAVSGLITSYNNKPEIIVKRASQINKYFR
jgi:hypothetical protein